VDWIYLGQYREQWPGFMNLTMNLRDEFFDKLLKTLCATQS
jgi:hypothetical protein